MGMLRCVMCGEAVLGASRREARVCSGPCATEALFEVVRLEGDLEQSPLRTDPDGVGEAEDPDGATARALLADFQLLYRRQELLRAMVAWHELTSVAASDDGAAPQAAADDTPLTAAVDAV